MLQNGVVVVMYDGGQRLERLQFWVRQLQHLHKSRYRLVCELLGRKIIIVNLATFVSLTTSLSICAAYNYIRACGHMTDMLKTKIKH